MYLSDLEPIARQCREGEYGLCAFLQHSSVIHLRWPSDVAEQWLYDHSGHDPFLRDYGDLDLARIQWDVEAVTTEDLVTLPTGPSEGDVIGEYARQPQTWIDNRIQGIHRGVGLCWETHGTWKRWPILIDQALLGPALDGLQVVEGRTRVGILRGRYRDGSRVADQHLVWVGRARP